MLKLTDDKTLPGGAPVRRPLAGPTSLGRPIRVLVVDDSVVIRRVVTQVLGADPAIEIAGIAANGVIALARIPQVNPDVVSLDIEMPEMDGLETLRRIRKQFPALRVIMFSTLTERGAKYTLEALSLGANDYVTKPANVGSLDRSMEQLRTELIPKIKQFFEIPPPPVLPQTRPAVQGVASYKPRHAAARRKSSPSASRPAGPTPWRRFSRSSRPTFRCRSRGAAHAAAVYAHAGRAPLQSEPAHRRRSGGGHGGQARPRR